MLHEIDRTTLNIVRRDIIEIRAARTWMSSLTVTAHGKWQMSLVWNSSTGVSPLAARCSSDEPSLARTSSRFSVKTCRRIRCCSSKVARPSSRVAIVIKYSAVLTLQSSSSCSKWTFYFSLFLLGVHS